MRRALTLRLATRLVALVMIALGIGLSIAALHAQQTCPCSLWTTSTTPGALAPDPNAVELGMKFRSDSAGFVTGVRFYKYAQNTGTHIGNLWTSSGTLLGTVTFSGETASGWQQATFPTPIAITANTTYVISYFTPTGNYALTEPGFTSSVDNAPLHGLSNSTSANGVYRYGSSSGFPNSSWNASNYWVDVVFSTTAADTTAPTITSKTPTPGDTNVPITSTVTATFSEAMTASTITTSTVDLRDGSNNLVPASVSYNSSTFVATLTPTASLTNGVTYTARVRGGSTGAKDAAGNALAADVTWTFTTIPVNGPSCPCSIWSTSATPGPQAPDPGAVELGMKFRSDSAGFVTGVRFYKYAANTGTHIGNLWSSTGTLLATVVFSGESASGWQQATFSSPVAVNANTTYVVSYFAPNGNYALTEPGFSTSVDNAPLHALANSTSVNGLYKYAASTSFPTSTWNASNYWVDVTFVTSLTDTTPPTVTSSTPASGSTNVPISTNVTATFNEAMTSSSITTSTIDLRDASNTPVAANVTYNASTFVATLTPTSALANGMIYTARVYSGAGGVKDAAGNALTSDFAWTFTTAVADTTPPTVTSISPVNGATAIATSSSVTVQFNEAMNASTISTSTIVLRDAGNNIVASTVSYNTATFVATLTPNATLANSATYGLTVVGGSGGVKDTSGNALAANVTSGFTTAAAGGCPCSLWTLATTPGPSSTDPNPVELGMKFRSDVAGFVTGIRFYKYSQNTGTHIGNLWTSGGTLLGSVTFSGESMTGWQQANFPSPIAISANTTYVISYFTPTGFYAGTQNGFASQIDNTPLHGLASTGSSPNGVYRYGSSSGFPTSTFTATNYWVDVVFATSAPDTTAPTVTMTQPSNNAVVSGTITVAAGASDNVGVANVQFILDGIPLGPADASSPYSVSWDTATASNGPHTLWAQAADAAGNTTNSLQVSVNVSNSSSLPPVSIDTTSFRDLTTASTTVTATNFSTSGPNELILAFVAADGSSSGTNVQVNSVSGGSLTWQLVQRTNAQRGTAEIWRAFADSALSDVSITATLSQSQIASMTVASFKNVDTTGTNGSGAVGAASSASAASGAPSATLSTTRNASLVLGVGIDWDHATPRTLGANQVMVHEFASTGAAADFWVQGVNSPVLDSGTDGTIFDVAPTTDRYNLTIVEVRAPASAGTTPPSITSITPGDNSTGVSLGAIVSATFSEAMNASTINSTNLELRNGSNALVPATIGYDASSKTAIIAPNSGLTGSTTYTATVKTGVRDALGNALPAQVSWSFTTAQAVTSPTQGGGGPILIITSGSDPFSSYYAEILRAEGLNEFATMDLTGVTGSVLSGYDVAILAQQTLTNAQVTMLTDWVTGGGHLIAMRPDKKLAALLGLTSTSLTVSNGYIKIDTSKAPGAGLVSQTIQFHNTADQYNLSGATAVATLYSTSSISTGSPAVTMVSVGANGGSAAAFTYDLARSVVYTRQGNPAWAGQERDGQAPIRSDDLFFGAKSGDIQPDWIDITKVAIPQADEQQRLLANMITSMNVGKRPLPRFWYFPQGKKAVVIMTGDNHGFSTVVDRFNQYVAASPAGCNVANWECIRSTAYIFPQTPVSNSTIANFIAQGFEVGVHLTMDPAGTGVCGSDFTFNSLLSTYNTRLGQFTSTFPSAGQPQTHRMHCVMWSDWSTQAQVERQVGIRLDASYYYWPPTWINDTPGMFTGSGMPMRIANLDGSMVDLYEAATQITDESGQTYQTHISTLLNNALGANGYYGAFMMNMHSDVATSADNGVIVTTAKSLGVPVVSAKQMLTWLDGRNGSVFGPIGWDGATLTFSVAAAAGANGLQVMIPTKAGSLTLQSVTLNGQSVSFTTQTIKGVGYAFVTVAPGQFSAKYQ
jgi:hypothetical protein